MRCAALEDFRTVLRPTTAADSSDGSVPVGHADGEFEPYCGLSSGRTVGLVGGGARGEPSPQQTGFVMHPSQHAQAVQ